MKNLILCFLVLIQSVIAQMAPQSLPEFEHLEGQNYLISWESVPGRVYFIQTSSSLRANQFNWEYAPDIRMGTGFPIDMGFKANASNFEFFRLVYTDYSGGLDPNLADFDGDGYTNLEEAIANSDPFDAQFFPGNNGQGVGGANAPPSEYGTTWNHPWEYTLTLEVNDHASPPDVINPDNPVSSYAYSRELGHDTKITFKDVIGKNSVTFLDLEPNPNYDPNDASSKKYNLEVVELSAQNPEWSHTGQLSTPPGGNLLPVEIVPDDDQPGKTGDVIPSNKGATGEKHYVSPKKSAEIADDFVVLKAKGIDQALFEKVLEWEGGEAVPNEPLKRRVKRDATGSLNGIQADKLR